MARKQVMATRIDIVRQVDFASVDSMMENAKAVEDLKAEAAKLGFTIKAAETKAASHDFGDEPEPKPATAEAKK